MVWTPYLCVVSFGEFGIHVEQMQFQRVTREKVEVMYEVKVRASDVQNRGPALASGLATAIEAVCVSGAIRSDLDAPAHIKDKHDKGS